MKTSKRLIEICCVCGFVHRDDRFGTRQRKLHFHWTPARGEVQTDKDIVHATVCLDCLLPHQPNTDRAWYLFRDGRLKTDPKYLSPGSCNAPLLGFDQVQHPTRARIERLYGIMADLALDAFAVPPEPNDMTHLSEQPKPKLPGGELRLGWDPNEPPNRNKP